MWNIFKAKAKKEADQLIVSKESFTKGIRELELFGLKRLSDLYISELYDRLDTSRDGNVELFELVSGLSIMCGGTADEKLGVFFDLYVRLVCAWPSSRDSCCAL